MSYVSLYIVLGESPCNMSCNYLIIIVVYARMNGFINIHTRWSSVKIIFQLIFSQIESLPKEELIKFVKKQLALVKQTKAKCEGMVYNLRCKAGLSLRFLVAR